MNGRLARVNPELLSTCREDRERARAVQDTVGWTLSVDAEGVGGGEELWEDDDDAPRWLEPDAVRAVSEALESLGHGAVLRRWDRRQMVDLDLYGGRWGADDRASVSISLGRLFRIYREATGAGEGMLLWIE